MRPRDMAEEHRSATPLELLFDLSFVVAVSQAAGAFAHDVEAGHAGEGLVDYAMVFFAIWWAWVNFTWFASAYDTDDVPYRLLTMLQMSGVLVVAAGIPRVFEHSDFTILVVGYILMRIALVAQWTRAAGSDPERRMVAMRYAVGVGVVQVLWVLWLGLADELQLIGFIVLAIGELAVPYVAERPNMTPWHPHHIAERYGLFTIIVLGESVFAATVAVEKGVDLGGVGNGVVTVAVSGLVLLFALWWLYFLEPSGEGLAASRHLAFLFGYSHYGIFASLAALGAGLEVGVAAVVHHVEASQLLVAYAVAGPTALYLVLLLAVFARFSPTPVIMPAHLVLAAAVVLALPFTTVLWSATVVTALVAAVAAALVAVTIARQHRVALPPRPDVAV